MNQFIGMVLNHPELDDRDIRIILCILVIQEVDGAVTQLDVADAVGVSMSEVEQRFQTLREKGLMAPAVVGELYGAEDFMGYLLPSGDNKVISINAKRRFRNEPAV